MAKPQVAVAPVLMSKLSANAPEFYPSGYANYTVSAAWAAARGPARGRQARVVMASLVRTPPAAHKDLNAGNRGETNPTRSLSRSYARGVGMFCSQRLQSISRLIHLM